MPRIAITSVGVLGAGGLTANGEPIGIRVVDPTVGGHTLFDLVLVAVKATQLAESLELVSPLVGPGTTFVSIPSEDS